MGTRATGASLVSPQMGEGLTETGPPSTTGSWGVGREAPQGEEECCPRKKQTRNGEADQLFSEPRGEEGLQTLQF